MTNAHNRFAEILAKYTSAMADIKRPTPAQQFDDDRRVLRPAGGDFIIRDRSIEVTTLLRIKDEFYGDEYPQAISTNPSIALSTHKAWYPPSSSRTPRSRNLWQSSNTWTRCAPNPHYCRAPRLIEPGSGPWPSPLHATCTRSTICAS